MNSDPADLIPSKHRILVVDDDASAREMVTRVLAGEGYSVWQAADGATALNMCRTVQFDLALLDLNLPGGEGLKTYETLAGKNPSLPVIIMTARSKQNTRTPINGGAAVIEKPLDFSRLLQTVSRVLAEHDGTESKLKPATRPK